MSSKKLAIFAILGLIVLGGAGFGLYLKKMNTDGFRGIGFSVQGVEKEAMNDWIKTFETVLQRDEILQEIVAKSDYAAKVEVPEGEAVEHLRTAIEIKHSSSRNTIQVGLRGKRKQNAELDGISQHIFNVAAPFVAQVKPAFGIHYQELSQIGQ